MRSLFLSLGFLAGCGDPVTTTVLDDVGTVCLASDGSLVLDFDQCLSSSCDTLVVATCEAALDGTTLTVTSHAEIEHQGKECTDDCGFVTATCTGDTVTDPAGIEVDVGGTTAALEACTMF
jgi:hypothetical protein